MEFLDPTLGIGKVFGLESSDSSSKNGRHFSNKVVSKLKSAKNAFYKRGAPELIFFNDFFF